MLPKHEFVICGVCGSREYVNGLKTFSIGFSKEIDGRPPVPIRYFIQQCRRCGYSAPAIAQGSPDLADYLKKPEYLNCENIIFPHEIFEFSLDSDEKLEIVPEAEKYYKHGLIMLWTNNIIKAYKAFMRAAWCCDDKTQMDGRFAELGKKCRLRATGLFDELIKAYGKGVDATTFRLITKRQVDALRRSDRFEDAVKLAEKNAEDVVLKPLMDYQISLCEKKDCAKHTTDDVCDFMVEHAEEYINYYTEHQEEYEQIGEQWDDCEFELE